uniref:E3 SUMO-protein ligase PIAS1 n=1 Tax=Melanaphis sacchari TaxID=742174 RepID=A0A2H8TFX7_9HEMI
MLSNQQNLNSEDQDSITSGNNNSFMQSTFNYKFNNVPFYEVIEDIIKPTLLKSSGKCTLENSPSGLMECAFNHTMSNEQATLISLNRDFTKKTADFVYQYQIRICQSEVGRSEVTDYLPLGLHIRIENETCSLPPIARYIQSGTEYRRVGRPINCTQHLKLSPLVSNSIIVNWIPDEKNYAFAMFIVKELNANTLIKKTSRKRSKEFRRDN